MSVTVLEGCALAVLPSIPDESVQCVVTSPPYWGLRDYGVGGQFGLEATPNEYVTRMVAVFREVRRVLKKDGTCWVNLGDSYVSVGTGKQGQSGQMATRRIAQVRDNKAVHSDVSRPPSVSGLPPKNLVGIPWRVAFALQADGWYLRQDIIWAKTNPMPESVRDRCTKSHEYLFLLSKNERYFYDCEAIAEDGAQREKYFGSENYSVGSGRCDSGSHNDDVCYKRNRRSVWTVSTQPFPGAHFATFPPALIEPCILAGTRAGDTVLDPFGGAGTTGLVADRLQRDAILIEINPKYAEMARDRIKSDSPLFALL